MKTKAWKANATMIAVCAGLAGVMCGCGDDTVGGTSGEAMTNDAGGSDAASKPDSTVADSGSTPDTGTTPADATTDSGTVTGDTGTGADVAVADSSTHDTGVVDSSTDGGIKDAVADVTAVDAGTDGSDGAAAQSLCTIFSNEYLLPDGGVDYIGDSRSWAVEIINGPASGYLADGGNDQNGNPGSIGLSEAVCASDSIMTEIFTDSINGNINAYSDYQNQVSDYEFRVFGCPGAPAYDGGGNGFALVPAEYGNGPLTQADLDNFVAFYVQQAQLVFQNHGLNLTQSQMDEMTTLLKATESEYPDIIAGSSATKPVCVDFDGGTN